MANFGLNKLKDDPRDFSHNETFGTLGAAQLPTSDFTIYDQLQYTVVWGDTLSKIAKKFGCYVQDIMNVNPRILSADKIYVGQVITIPARKYEILNQLSFDFCTAFTNAEIQNAIWGIPVDPFYQMAKTKQIMGSIQGYGADLRDAMKSLVKYGSIQLSSRPYDGTQQRDFLCDWKNYPAGLDTVALKERDLSFFAVDGTMDMFDNIRSTLWKHRNERRAVSFGLFWHEAWTEAPNGVIPDQMPMDAMGGGHNMAIVGQKTINGTIYLVFQQSWGPTAGDNGFYYFPREVVNASAREGYGAFTVSNIDGSGNTGNSGILTFVATIINKFLGNI